MRQRFAIKKLGIRIQLAAVMSGLILTAFTSTVHAQGNFVYRDLGSFWMLGDGNFPVRYNLDFNEDGHTDFIIEAGESFRPIGTGANAVYSYPEPPGDLGANALPLEFGQSIGPNLPPGDVWFETYQAPNVPFPYLISSVFHTVLGGGMIGPWFRGTTAYMGAQFDIDGALHYGWLRIEVPEVNAPNGGIIHDMAYNTIPGMPILAGQVPEPSTWALLVAGGSFLWWRRLRAANFQIERD